MLSGMLLIISLSIFPGLDNNDNNDVGHHDCYCKVSTSVILKGNIMKRCPLQCMEWMLKSKLLDYGSTLLSQPNMFKYNLN